jgi:CheY-like chemotaxis protein
MLQQRVLIADHDPAVAGLVDSILSESGYRTLVVHSSSDAIQRAPGFGPELVIIDPIMPGVSGLEAATQIAKATRSRLLFLTTLCADPDFREVLRGIRQQGHECGALPKPFKREQLLDYLRRAMGPVGAETPPQSAHDGATVSGRPGAPPESEPGTGTNSTPFIEPVDDYEPLFAISTTRVYEKNAFRITGLNVDAPLRELAREVEKLEMANKLGVVQSQNAPFPLRVAPDTNEIRLALQTLTNPEQRLLNEFFWFWPLARTSREDEALNALREHKYERAVSIWKRDEGQDKTGTTVHNLAVYYHLAALEGELAKSGGPPPNDSSWQISYGYWIKLVRHHSFWDRMIERIKQVSDPRLTIDSAKRIWFSLPASILGISAQLAVAAAEAGNFEEAGRQRRLMFASNFGEEFVADALRRALVPLKEEIARLCSTAVAEAGAQPKKADAVVRRLFTQKKRILQAFNYLLGAGDVMRDSVSDLVAQSGRSCLIAYANETEDWTTSQTIGEECLALAEGKALRARLEEDLETVGANLSSQPRRQSQSQAEAHPKSSAPYAAQAPPPSPRSAPSSRPSKAGGWIAAVVIGIVIIIGVVNGAKEDRTKGEITQLKSEIESNRSRLGGLEADLKNRKESLDGYKAQIDSDKTRLEQMKQNDRLGLPVDGTEYEKVRLQHNATVGLYNTGLNDYNHKYDEYEALLRMTNEEIERYNTLVKSQ